MFVLVSWYFEVELQNVALTLVRNHLQIYSAVFNHLNNVHSYAVQTFWHAPRGRGQDPGSWFQAVQEIALSPQSSELKLHCNITLYTLIYFF